MCRSERLIFGLIAVLCMGVLHAQDNPVRLPEREYIHPEQNGILLKGDSTSWNRWNAKLDSLFTYGRGQVNIVHIGGSHIQADMWSMEVRHRFQNVVPGVGGARGFIFPYVMAKTNNPYWYLPTYTGTWAMEKNTTDVERAALGLAGYSVTTTDPHTELTISFRGNVYNGYRFNKVKVLHKTDRSFAITASCADTSIAITQHTDHSAGFTEFSYSADIDTLHLHFDRTDTLQKQFALYGITLDNDDPGFVYSAVGVNGASTASYLRCERFTPDLALLNPDLVVFSIGINDAHDSKFSAARFKKNYQQLIAKVRQAAPHATILLTTNTDSYIERKDPNLNNKKVREVMLELSKTHGCAVWDMYTVMGGTGSISEWQKAGIARPDLIHFDRNGYVLLGDLMFGSIMESYGNYVQRNTGN